MINFTTDSKVNYHYSNILIIVVILSYKITVLHGILNYNYLKNIFDVKIFYMKLNLHISDLQKSECVCILKQFFLSTVVLFE